MTTKFQHVQRLSQAGFRLWVDDQWQWVVVDDVYLPVGYNRDSTPLLIELPIHYPLLPPGVGGSHVFIASDIRWRGRQLRDLHPQVTPDYETPGWSRRSWAWLCYEDIDWNPLRDNLITFVEMVRANLTNPEPARWSL